jgi:hypothetical protein
MKAKTIIQVTVISILKDPDGLINCPLGFGQCPDV